MTPADYLRAHRCHDVPFLLKRWHAVARAARLTVRAIHVSGLHPVLFVHSNTAGPRLYFSAGVHGDEPAPVSGLLEWAEENVPLLRRLPVAMMPLFNPSGLSLNTRADQRGIDLNRRFHDASHPHIAAWWRAIGDMTFTTGFCLHEDYDGRGIYCYELYRTLRLRFASAALAACEHIIPRDPRRSIDTRRAHNGLIRRKRVPNLPGLPESIALFFHNTDSTLTFETPSEFSLADRVAAHKAFLTAVTAGR
jgi:murein peptide amidase A